LHTPFRRQNTHKILVFIKLDKGDIFMYAVLVKANVETIKMIKINLKFDCFALF